MYTKLIPSLHVAPHQLVDRQITIMNKTDGGIKRRRDSNLTSVVNQNSDTMLSYQLIKKLKLLGNRSTNNFIYLFIKKIQ